MGRKPAAAAPPPPAPPAVARPLTSVMPRTLVIAFAVLAFVLANLLLLLGVLAPEKTENPTARFILCLAIALNLSIFLFVLYPQSIKITKVPLVDLTVQIVGPAALHIVLLLLIWKMMPEPPTVSERFFIPVENGRRVTRLSAETVVLKPYGEDFTYYKVPDEDGLLAGILVKFGRGKDEYKASFRAPFYHPVEILFRRGPGEGSFEVESNRSP